MGTVPQVLLVKPFLAFSAHSVSRLSTFGTFFSERCAVSKSTTFQRIWDILPEKTSEQELVMLQGYLAHKKHPPRRTLQQPYA